MNDEDALLRGIIDNPGEDAARLVYADWLDERDDPRGAYLRAELAWAQSGERERQLRTLGKPLDAVWVARVSRPPVGVCLRHSVFEFTGPELTYADVQEHEGEIPYLPNEYVAFLLNYNGGMLFDYLQDPAFLTGDSKRPFWYCEGFSQLATDEPDDLFEVPIKDPESLPSIQWLAENLYHPNTSSNAWGGSADQLFTDYTVIGFARAEFGHFNYLLLGEMVWRGKSVQRVFAYTNPNGDQDFFDGLSEAQCDNKAARFNPQRNLLRVANSFPEFLQRFDLAK